MDLSQEGTNSIIIDPIPPSAKGLVLPRKVIVKESDNGHNDDGKKKKKTISTTMNTNNDSFVFGCVAVIFSLWRQFHVKDVTTLI